jgi:hypothetical protein
VIETTPPSPNTTGGPLLQNEKNPLRTETFRKQIDGIAGKLWNDEYPIIGPSGEFKAWRGKPHLFELEWIG